MFIDLTWPRVIRPPNVPIHNLDDDSLLSIFNLCRPNPFKVGEYGDVLLANRDQQCWWYKLVKVCRRWRHLILGSASHLSLCLVCSRGTPVAEMLAHPPPLPLIIDHDDENRDLTPEDEKGIMFALQHRARVRRICSFNSLPRASKNVAGRKSSYNDLRHVTSPTPPDSRAPMRLQGRGWHLAW